MSDDNKEGAGVPVRECGNGECGWKGFTDRMLGSIGPLCPKCGETTEPAVMPAAPSDAAVEILALIRSYGDARQDGNTNRAAGWIRDIMATLSQTMQPQAGAVGMPELPEPGDWFTVGYVGAPSQQEGFYTADQMRAYGAECILAAPGAAIAAREQEDKS